LDRLVHKSKQLKWQECNMYGTTRSLDYRAAHCLSFLMLAMLLCHPAFCKAGASFSGVSISATSLVLSATNGQPGGTYNLLTTTNLALPQSHWTPVATNVLSAGGNFTITVTNAVTTGNPQHFYILQLASFGGMALIPAGSFTMGDTLDGESDAIPTVTVMVSSFYMDTNLVTLSEWQAVYNWATNNGYGFDNSGTNKAANNPVQYVDWYDCVKWCNARSQLTGLAPVYYTDAGMAQVYTNGLTTNPFVLWSANGYRLPTEAEWEKAARGGLSGQRFPWGDTISTTQATYFGCTNCYSYDLGPNGHNPLSTIGGSPETTPVGSFAPNGYGLYDIVGDSWVWCWDWYGTPYGQPSLTDPTGPATGSTRVLRAGGWNRYAVDLRCATRDSFTPFTTGTTFGTCLRCVRAH
jgi:formylglycine-generating enzyme